MVGTLQNLVHMKLFIKFGKQCYLFTFTYDDDHVLSHSTPNKKYYYNTPSPTQSTPKVLLKSQSYVRL